MSERKREAGIAELLSLLIALSIVLILAAAAVPSLISAHQISNATDIRNFMVLAEHANAISAQCGMTSGCVSSPDVLGAIPVAGTLDMDGYTVTTTVAPFTITATSSQDLYSGQTNFFIGNDGILRCTAVPLVATAAASPCQ